MTPDSYPLRNAAAVVAMGVHVVGNDQPRISSLELQLRACRAAMDAAGLDRRDIGAVFTGRAPMSYSAMEWNMRIINELKIVPKLSSEITVHGAGVLATWQYAAMAVANGLVDYALCAAAAWVTAGSTLSRSTRGSRQTCSSRLPTGRPRRPCTRCGASATCTSSGCAPESTARIAVENRRWALHHPDALDA